MRIDFARLNHVLIPKTKEERDKFREGKIGRVVGPIAGLWASLTEEGRLIAVLTFVVGAFSVDPKRADAYILFAAMFAVILGALLAARRLVLHGVTVRVVAPRRVTVGEDVTFDVVCEHARGAKPVPPIRIRGPFLTWDGAWIGDRPSEIAIAEGRSATTTMRARFVARGMHHLEAFSAAAVAPLGLTCGPRVYSEAIKIHIVPRVANVVRLPETIVSRHQPGGVALASKSGESMDLLGVRPYRPGDPVRDLHARSWARTGMPVVREYQQEYFTRVGVVLDTDTADPELLEAAIELAAGIIARLSRGEALVDVLVVGDVVHELTLGRSLGYLEQALELLASVEHGQAVKASVLARRLDPHLARLSSVFVVSLGVGGERRLLEQAIEDHGVRATMIIVDENLAAAIRAGAPLSW